MVRILVCSFPPGDRTADSRFPVRNCKELQPPASSESRAAVLENPAEFFRMVDSGYPRSHETTRNDLDLASPPSRDFGHRGHGGLHAVVIRGAWLHNRARASGRRCSESRFATVQRHGSRRLERRSSEDGSTDRRAGVVGSRRDSRLQRPADRVSPDRPAVRELRAGRGVAIRSRRRAPGTAGCSFESRASTTSGRIRSRRSCTPGMPGTSGTSAPSR